MKVSIITVCFNSEKYISRAIESVLSQNYLDVEYLIIDGGSKDSTVSICNSYIPAFAEKEMSYIISSEADNGIYDAMNKGISRATGDVIGILNSDDFYASNDILSMVMKNMKDNDIDSCFGNLLYIKNNKPYRYWKSGAPRTFKFGWMPPHPTFFVRKNVYNTLGIFRLDCGTAADYELMLRFLEKNHISTMWINKTFTFMEAGGASSASLKAYKKAHGEDNDAWKKNGIKAPFAVAWLKKIRKLPQFITAKFIKL
ncbi:MAG: glycosyltransferase [Treponema sp.]|nr:glycosyltransferase [Treponema sp.]